MSSSAVQTCGGSPGGGYKPCCCDSPARARTCFQGKEKGAARLSWLSCAMNVQLWRIDSAAQTTPQVHVGRKGQRSLGDSRVLVLRGDQKGSQEQEGDTNDQGEHAASASCCLLCLSHLRKQKAPPVCLSCLSKLPVSSHFFLTSCGIQQ